jgi:hypothetical protein
MTWFRQLSVNGERLPLLQLRALRLGFLQDGTSGQRLPEREEILLGRLGLGGVASHGIGVHHAAIWSRKLGAHFWLRR